MGNKRAKRVIEASLFTAPGTVHVKELAAIAGLNFAEARVLVTELMHDYEAKGTSLEIRNEPDGVRMTVKPEYENHVSHMAAAPELHRGIMKTLAYIAYKQPVAQANVIKFRNSKAYEHITTLVEKGFVRKEKKGITYILFTTPKFREYFGKDAGAGKNGAMQGPESAPNSQNAQSPPAAGNPENADALKDA